MECAILSSANQVCSLPFAGCSLPFTGCSSTAGGRSLPFTGCSATAGGRSLPVAGGLIPSRRDKRTLGIRRRGRKPTSALSRARLRSGADRPLILRDGMMGMRARHVFAQGVRWRRGECGTRDWDRLSGADKLQGVLEYYGSPSRIEAHPKTLLFAVLLRGLK